MYKIKKLKIPNIKFLNFKVLLYLQKRIRIRSLCSNDVAETARKNFPGGKKRYLEEEE